MVTQTADIYSGLDTYDIGTLLARMLIDSRFNKRHDQETENRMLREATVQDLLDVRSQWMSEKGEEFEAKYRGARNCLERGHNTPEKLGETPIMKESRAYQEWLKYRQQT